MKLILACALLAAGCAFGSAARAPKTPRSTAKVDQFSNRLSLAMESETGDSDEGGLQQASFADSGSAHIKEPAPSEKLVITGEVTAITDDVAGLVADIRKHAIGVGGSIANEGIDGDAQHRNAAMTLRLPPAAMGAFVDWLAERSTLDRRHLLTTDVSRQYFDRDLAIRNLEVTMGRLHELAKRQNADLKEVIAVEHEMTRVRGELERLRGEQRVVGDQVARATLTVTIQMKRGVHAEPQLKFELVPHLTVLHLVDPAGRDATRTGGGVTVMFSRWFSLDFEMLPGVAGGERSYLFTLTSATYSDFLGGGRRRFLNPYLGVRAGGATIDGNSAFVWGADAGLEIVRFKLFLVEISGRALGLAYGSDNTPSKDFVLEGVLGVGVPF